MGPRQSHTSKNSRRQKSANALTRFALSAKKPQGHVNFWPFFATLVLFLRNFLDTWAIWLCFLAKTHWDSEKCPLGLLIFASTNSGLGGFLGQVAALVTFYRLWA